MKTANKCYLARAQDIVPKWYVVDATDMVLGRLAVKLATILMGKHKPIYTPHVDTGDFVVVLNVDKIRVTGRKAAEIFYMSYSGYPSGHKIVPYERMMERHPERVLTEAVRRMLPKNSLARRMILKLKAYAGDQHPHQAQQPEPLAL